MASVVAHARRRARPGCLHGGDDRARERATTFAQGVTPVRFVRDMIDEALIVGLLATAVGAAPLLTLPRLRRTVNPATLRVVE